MSIYEQILYWIDKDSMDFILTVFCSLLFFDGVLPAWIDKIKDQNEEDQEDLM